MEGLLTDIKEDMGGNQFLMGDSVIAERKEKVHSILRQIDEVGLGDHLYLKIVFVAHLFLSLEDQGYAVVVKVSHMCIWIYGNGLRNKG